MRMKPMICLDGETPEFDPGEDPVSIELTFIGLYNMFVVPFGLTNLIVSHRARNRLNHIGAKTVWDLARMNAREVANIPMCGRKTRKEIYDEVKRVWGIKLHDWLYD